MCWNKFGPNKKVDVTFQHKAKYLGLKENPENPEFPTHNYNFVVTIMSVNTHEFHISDNTWMPVSPSNCRATILSMWWWLSHQQRPLALFTENVRDEKSLLSETFQCLVILQFWSNKHFCFPSPCTPKRKNVWEIY